MFLDRLTKLNLRQVCRRETGVEWFSAHRVEVFDGVDKCASDIPDMQVIAAEVALEDNDGLIIHRSMREVINEKIQPHARGRAKRRGQAQRHRVFAAQDRPLRLDLRSACMLPWRRHHKPARRQWLPAESLDQP